MGRPRFKTDEDFLAAFNSKWEEDENGCHVWTASIISESAPYGRFHAPRSDGKRKPMRAHRYIWEVAHGPVPEGLVVRHRCDNSLCVNVEHLLLGTQRDNLEDGWSKGRIVIGRPKLSASEKDEIRELLGKGHSQTRVAKRYGVDQSLISMINTGKVV